MNTCKRLNSKCLAAGVAVVVALCAVTCLMHSDSANAECNAAGDASVIGLEDNPGIGELSHGSWHPVPSAPPDDGPMFSISDMGSSFAKDVSVDCGGVEGSF